MTDMPLANRRPPLPFETARSLYQGVFAAQTKTEQEIASRTWLALAPGDRSFIACHLQYLNLIAQSRTQHLLEGLRETLDNLTGATYAIADVVTAAESPDSEEQGIQDPEQLEASWREAERLYGFQADAGGGRNIEPHSPLEPMSSPAATPHEFPPGPSDVPPERDAGQIAASVLPVVPTGRSTTLADAFTPTGASSADAGTVKPATERKRSGGRKVEAPALPEKEESHVE